MTAYIVGAVVGAIAGGWVGSQAARLYRRWYVVVRNELEALDPTNRTLRKIGVREAAREWYEEDIYL